MRQNFSILTYTLIILFLQPLPTKSQDTQNFQPQTYFRFDSIAWNKISNRYERSQARAEIQLKDGMEKNGQIVLIDNDKIIIYPGYEVIIKPDLAKDYTEININEISKIKVKRNTRNYEAMIVGGALGGFIVMSGGALALWADATIWTVSPFFLGGAAAGGLIGKGLQQFPRRYNFENNRQDDIETLNSLQQWAIFKDSIHYYRDFRDLVDHSALVERGFPSKKFKIAFAIQPVVNRVGFSTNIKNVINLDFPNHTSKGNGFESSFSLSSAFKAGEKYNIGAEWFNNEIPGAFSYDLSDSLIYKIYPIRIKGIKFFTEYSLVSPDRYMTRRFGVLCGAGITFARSDQSIYWFMYDIQDGIGIEYNNGDMGIGETKLKGISGHVQVNYYVSPNTSLFAGFEGNLFQSIKVPGVDELTVDSNATSIDFQVPEYSINYSSVRMKFGVNFHL